jgi:hypothetical protein
MKILLSYVNKEHSTVVVKHEFDTLPQVSAWVDKHHPEWTSYDVVVIRTAVNNHA